METFEISLANGATLTGRCNLPAPPPSPKSKVPLLVGLHGGTYTSTYFDANDDHTARICSNALKVPFVAINRPCYGGSSPFPSIPEDSSFAEETGRWLHEYILPALWARFGDDGRCSCVILYGHSMGVVGGVVAAGLHAQESLKTGGKTQYPLGGIIIAGSGTRRVEFDSSAIKPISETELMIPPALKIPIMLPNKTADPGIYDLTEELDCPVRLDELVSLDQNWFDTEWQARWVPHITVPVMVMLAGEETFVQPTEEHLREFLGSFSASSRRDGSIVPGAPHCAELSYWSQGWYARGFGFAKECAVSYV